MTSVKSSAILKDVVAFVDVWSSSRTENYSKPFAKQLREMGAEVSETFNKRVTHVVFKHGRQSTWNKAKKSGVKLVSVFWVDRCKDAGQHVDEELCPATHKERQMTSTFNKRTHRCMQPRDIPERTPENDKSMKKKLDRMIKGLVSPSPTFPDVSPYIIDEESGIVYSPSSRRTDLIAQRLEVMKKERESLSLTDSCEEINNLNVSFDDLHGSPRNKQLEKQHCVSMPPVDFSFNETNFESKRKSKVLSSCPEDLFDENKFTQTSSGSYVQDKQPTTKDPCIKALFGKGTRTKSPTESQNVMNITESNGFDPKKPSSALFPLDVYNKSISLSTSVSNRQPIGAERKQGKYRKDPPSFLKVFCQRKNLKTPNSRTPPESASVSPSEDDEVFENYFSPANNHGKSGAKHRAFSLGLSSKPTLLPPFELEPKLRKRKRDKSEMEELCPARGKRKMCEVGCRGEPEESLDQPRRFCHGSVSLDADTRKRTSKDTTLPSKGNKRRISQTGLC